MTEALVQLSEELGLLGSVVRLRILDLLRKRSDEWVSLRLISELLDLPLSTASRHLKDLKTIGLVEKLQAGSTVSYRAKEGALGELAERLQTLGGSQN